MYAVKEGKVMINGRKVRVYGRAVLEKDTALNAVAGTTGYRGKEGRPAEGPTSRSTAAAGISTLIPSWTRMGL